MSDDPLFHSLPPVDAATWRQQVERDLGVEIASLATEIDGGLLAAPIYPDRGAAGDVTSAPGLPPFRRGGRLAGGPDAWRIAQVYDHPEPAEVGAALRRDCDLGLRTAWLRFDPGGRRGDGMAISNLHDVETVLAELTFAEQGLIVDGGPDGLATAALMGQALVGQEREPDSLAFATDPLASLARDGILPGSLADSWRQLEVVTTWAEAATSSWWTTGVSTVPYHDGGAHHGQELAFALATGVEYLRALTASGRSVAAASKRMFFTFAVGRDLFLEIAKLRAARWLWAKVIQAAGGDAHAQQTRIVACTSATTKARRGPWINQLRLTTETFAAVLGGADDVVTAPFDQALGSRDSRGGRLAINTQHILAEEAHLGRVADPAGGSGYVENLTEQLARRAWDRFRAIERQGGMAACLCSGAIADEVAARAANHKKAVACRRDPFVGISAFALVGESSDEPIEQRVARERPPTGVSDRDDHLHAGVEAVMAVVPDLTAENLALAVATGAPCEAPRVEPVRWPEPFEQLQDAANRATGARGSRPACLVIRLGAARHHQPQAAFARRALGVGGLRVVEPPEPLADAKDTALDLWASVVCNGAVTEVGWTRDEVSGAAVPPAVVCPGDLDVELELPPVLAALRQAGIPRLILAGPATDADGLADDVIRDGSDLLVALAGLHAILEIEP